MSEMSQGPGWWLASDGKWYPPQNPAQPAPGSPPYQPGGPPQPGYAGPATPAKKKKGALFWILMLLGVLLVCGGGGCGAFVLLIRSAVSAPIDATNAWLEAAKTNNTATLRDLTCSLVDTPSGLVEQVTSETGGTISSYSITSANVSSTGGRSTASAAGTVTGSSTTNVTFFLTETAGKWQVCGVT